MAGVAAAVDAVVSNLDALLLLPEQHNKLSRGARRDAAFIRGALQEGRGLVAELAAAEDEDGRRRQLRLSSSRQRRGGCSSSSSASSYQIESLRWQLDGLTRDLDGLRWHTDPRGRSAPGYCSRALRALCYDAEDTLDALAFRRRRWWAVKKLSLRVAVKLGTIKARADAASKRLRNSPWRPADTATGVPAEEEGFRCRPHPAAPPELVVGMDSQRDELADMLLSGDDQELKVVAVVGDEGAGKTALVHEVYRAVGPSFECRAWVPASGKKSSSWVRILNEVARQVGAGGSDGEEWQKSRNHD
ncbi:unnamed protein product [Urochloa humidicola]